MAILAECPICHRKQAIRNKVCSCGQDLAKAKKAKEKVKYWITYRLPGGKQRKEYVGYKLEDAKAAEGKRRGQKRENRIFEMLPGYDLTFNELSEWYLGLPSMKRKKAYKRIEGA
jgi:hypothetical protein